MADPDLAKSDYAAVASGTPAKAGRRVFRPRLWPTLAAIALIPVFIALGQWQWKKASIKGDLQAELDRRSAQPPRRLSAADADTDAATLRFRQVTVRGHYEPLRQIFIDNRLYREQAGYHVLTPLRIEGSTARVLVNRGWIPASVDHRQVPEVLTPSGALELQGTAIVPGTRFFTLAPEAPGWHAVHQNLDLARYRQETGGSLLPIVIQLDPADPGGGFVRDWPRPSERLEQHLSYALQWWGFAFATVAIWLAVNWRRL